MKARPHRIKYYVLIFYLLIVAGWQALYWAGQLPDYLFPSPSDVVKRLWELTTENYLWPSVKATFQRMGAGFSIAASLGLLVGLFMGVSRVVNSCLRSCSWACRPFPRRPGCRCHY